MDWSRSIEISRRQIVIYTESIGPLLHRFCGGVESKNSFWTGVKRAYLGRISGEYQANLAYAFPNSVHRKVFRDQCKTVESTYGDAESKPAPDILRHLWGGPNLDVETASEILRVPGFQTSYRDLAGDAARLASRISETLRMAGGASVQIEAELRAAGETLGAAAGFPGTVAIGFAAPTSEFVLKVIRNHPTAGYKWGKFPGVEAVLSQAPPGARDQSDRHHVR
jgi:isocitrate dehydrogenase kinase/phosphatase